MAVIEWADKIKFDKVNIWKNI